MKQSVRVAIGLGLLVIVGAAVAAGAVGFGGIDPQPAPASGLPTATAPVTRATLTQTEQVVGTLGYGPSTTISGHGKGTLTFLPPPGAIIRQGQAVYRADNIPVPLWFGTLPLYRTLRPGAAPGPDVEEVEKNLVALGYTGISVDTRYTSATAEAVRRWQHDLGMHVTGTIAPAAVVIAPAAIRIATHQADLGNADAGPLMTYTSTTRIVDVALDVAKQSLVRPGITATVTLPDDTTVPGTVSHIGTVATEATQDNPATIEVTIKITKQGALGTLDAAPVDVTLVSARVTDVLTVPVEALVALADGGYGVQVVTGSTSQYIAVDTGLFGNGRVQISGPGIVVGTVVGVPQ